MMDEKLNQLLRAVEEEQLELPGQVVVVDVARQRLSAYLSLKLAAQYPVSTSRHGLGEDADSFKTPRGLHSIADRIGKDVAPGTPFESRKPTAILLEDWSNNGDVDAILTRILRLRGLTIGLNSGPGIDSHERMIYIHGTNQEHLLGHPASHGCIRMGNRDVAGFFDWLGDNPALCWIG
jgi:hypothetical protein